MLLNKIFYQTFFMLLIACSIGLNEVYAQALSVTASYTQVACDHDGVVTATVTGGVPPYTYSWQWGYPAQYAITNTNVLSNLSGVHVALTVTDAAAQSYYCFVYGIMPLSTQPYTINANCPINDGSITISAYSPAGSTFTYSWYNNGTFLSSGSSNVLNNLPSGGDYDAKVIDAIGCSIWLSESDSLDLITVGSTPTIALNPSIIQANCVNGSITLNPTNGTAPYTYTWKDNTTNTILASTTNIAQNLVAFHNYRAIVTDANTCVRVQDIYMPTNLTLSSANQVTPEHCDDADGTAMAIPLGNATPPYTYSWNTNPTQITQTITGLHGGDYQCFMVSANGCILSNIAHVPIISPINITYTSTPGTNNCNNPSGTATLTVTGGVSPYSYSWSNGQTSQTATGLGAGSYYFVVTDASGCRKSGYVVIAPPNPLDVTVTNYTNTSCATPNGQITIAGLGGTSPYSYSWSNGQMSQTATNLNVGDYTFWIADAAGCIFSSSIEIHYSGIFQPNISTTPELCPNGNGSATVSVNGGIAPYTYSWSNGQNTATINNLTAGTYQCQITDANSCTIIYPGYVTLSSPVTVNATVSNASCLFVADGSITINASGGVAPYTYHLLNGNIIQSSPIFMGLQGNVNYYFTVTDANGCIRNHTIHVGYNNISNCGGTIAGVVYDDANQNCVQDAGETGIPNTMVSCTGFGSVWTNNAGYYEFLLPLGTYTVQHYPSMYHKAKCPANGLQSLTLSAGGLTVNADFADSTYHVFDLRTSIYNTNLPVPGSYYSQHIVYENVGDLPVANTEPRYVYDNELSIYSINPTPLSTIYTPEEQTFGSMTLQPATYFDVNASYYVPTNVPLGTVLTYQDTAFPIVGDTSVWDNHSFHQVAVVGSYDPNYKEVAPKGEGSEGYITVNDSILEYVIHFQNTGTAPAHNVTLIDTLDTDLELTSVEMGYSTHQYVAKISENRVLEIYFQNIMLPDSGADMVGSNGLVAFRIKQKKNLPFGTQFTNQAGIIFDFNYPIYTNTTLNTLHELTNVEKPVIETLGLFPNPAQNVLNIEIPYELQGQDLTFECLDLTGKVVMSKQNIHVGKTEISVAELPQGWYFARAIGKNTLLNGKFVIVR